MPDRNQVGARRSGRAPEITVAWGPQIKKRNVRLTRSAALPKRKTRLSLARSLTNTDRMAKGQPPTPLHPLAPPPKRRCSRPAHNAVYDSLTPLRRPLSSSPLQCPQWTSLIVRCLSSRFVCVA